MSVMIGLRVSADVAKFTEVVTSDPERMQGIAQRGKDAGAIHHRFFGSVNGDEILVVDEWPSVEAFQGFFENSPDIGEFMREAGVTTEPQVAFWEELDTPDKF
jgi:hypothetical protein